MKTFSIIFDMFILLLIGMGPKVALVPFLDLTAEMEEAVTQRKVARKMVVTAVGVALILVLLGGFLMKLLHFHPGGVVHCRGHRLYVAGPAYDCRFAGKSEEHQEKAGNRDAMKMALVSAGGTLPAESGRYRRAGHCLRRGRHGGIDYAILLVLVLVMGVIDMLVFGNIGKVSKHLDPSRMVVTEVVFGVLLAALAVQLVLEWTG